MRIVAAISSKFLALSYFFDMAPRLFQKVESLTFQKMYGGICHLKWYRWANFMDLAHGLQKRIACYRQQQVIVNNCLVAVVNEKNDIHIISVA